jgi:DNA-directed RNA polymerase subunit N (RpoN/RPB10)
MSLIPMRCFTCGEPLASKYVSYVNQVEQEKSKDGGCAVPKTTEYLKDPQDMTKSAEAKVMDKLELFKMCCRRHMLTHVDIY